MASIQRILVATDFSPCSQAALQGAHALAERLAAVGAVVHVWAPSRDLSPRLPLRPAREERVTTLWELARQTALDELRKSLGKSCGARFAPRVEIGTPHELILTLAAAERHDLIVMGARGLGAPRTHLGSVTRRVLDSAHCPVLVFRAPEPPTGQRQSPREIPE